MKTNLHFTACIGRVVQCSTFIKTFTIGGNQQRVSVTNRRGIFDPTRRHATASVRTNSWVHTDHFRRVEFIVQDHRGVDHPFWVEGYNDFMLREGQHVAFLSANNRPVRVANFTSNETYSFCSGAELVAKKKALGFWASAALVYGGTVAVCYLLGSVVMMFGARAQARIEHLLDGIGSNGNPLLLLLAVAVAVRLGCGVFFWGRRAARVKLADQEIANAWDNTLTFPPALVSLRAP